MADGDDRSGQRRLVRRLRSRIGPHQHRQQVGGALGLGILAAIANSRTSDVMAAAAGDPSAVASALTEGFQAAFIAGTGVAVLAIFAALTLISSSDSRARVEVKPAELPIA
jgi:hypothetical protein